MRAKDANHEERAPESEPPRSDAEQRPTVRVIVPFVPQLSYASA